MPRSASRSICLALVALMALAASACGSSSSDRPAGTRTAVTTAITAPTDGANEEPAKDVIAQSAEKFRLATSYRVRVTIEAPNIDGSIQGEAAYQSDDAIYAQTTFVIDEQPSDALKSYLFLPPDLYLQQRDGAWFVQSPWNQGIKPAEQKPQIGLQQPIVDYTDLAHHLHDAETTASGEPSRHLRARVDQKELTSLVPGRTNGSATVDVWIAPGDDLPQKIQLKANGLDGFLVVMEFSDFNQEIARPAAPDNARPFRDAVFPDAPCIGDQLAGCLEAQTQIQGADSCPGTGRRVCIVPLGKISPDLIANLVAAYKDTYGLTVTVLTPAAIPADLEDPKRQQIDCVRLLEYMGTLFPADYRDREAVLIGITSVDLYDAKSHVRYLFGVKRTPADPKAVMSPLRMNPQFYGEPADGPLYYARARKLVSKYIGFLYYRLPLSSDPTSPLYDSIGGPDDVDRMTEPLPAP